MKLENFKNTTTTTTKQSWEWYCLSTLVSISVQIPDTDQCLEAEAAPEQTEQYTTATKGQERLSCPGDFLMLFLFPVLFF